MRRKFVTVLCRWSAVFWLPAFAPLVRGSETRSAGVSAPDGQQLLSELLGDCPEIVFACRQEGGDGHWYANFGYYAAGKERKAYRARGRLCKLNVRTGDVVALVDDPEGTVRDPQVHYHHLWTMNPDGTGQMVYCGNMHPGTVMIDAKPIPGTETVVAVFSPGHGMREHAGVITIVDPSRGPDEPAAARRISKGENFRDPPAGRHRRYPGGLRFPA